MCRRVAIRCFALCACLCLLASSAAADEALEESEGEESTAEATSQVIEDFEAKQQASTKNVVFQQTVAASFSTVVPLVIGGFITLPNMFTERRSLWVAGGTIAAAGPLLLSPTFIYRLGNRAFPSQKRGTFQGTLAVSAVVGATTALGAIIDNTDVMAAALVPAPVLLNIGSIVGFHLRRGGGQEDAQALERGVTATPMVDTTQDDYTVGMSLSGRF